MLTHRLRHVPHRHAPTLAAGLALVATLAAFLVLLLAVGPAGAAGQRVWVRHYAWADGIDQWTSLAKGPSNTVYAAGTRNFEWPTERAIVARYTTSGTRLWLRTFGGKAGDAVAAGIAVDAKGNAFVTGSERYGAPAEWHIWVMKLRAKDGRRLWLKRYDGPPPTGDDTADSVATGPSGAIYVSGQVSTTTSGYNAILFKYADKGRRAALKWKRTYSNTSAAAPHNADDGRRVVVDGAGRVYWGGSTQRSDAHYATFVRRVSAATGRTVWTSLRVGGSGNDLWLTDLVAFPKGGCVAACQRSDTAATGRGILVRRYAATGGGRANVLLDSAGDEVVNDLAVDGAGNIAVAGQYVGAGDGIATAWVVRGNSRFKSRWQRTLASPQAGEPAEFAAVAIGGAGAVYCGGHSNTGFITGDDFLVAKYSSAGVSRWHDVYDDRDANRADSCKALIYVGGSKPALYGAGVGGATTWGEALLIKYKR